MLQNGEIRWGQVVLITQVFRIFKSISYKWLDIAVGVDAADFPVIWCVASKQQSYNFIQFSQDYSKNGKPYKKSII